MNKIGFFLSMFSNDNIENSISYITTFCVNIKRFNELKEIHPNIDLIVNTDEFTYNIICDICRQEGIDISKIIFHKHRRNSYLRGMFWRFESFYSDEYDITINGEGDYDIRRYFKEIEYFEKNNFDLLIFSVRQIAINNNAIAGGRIFIRPKQISSEIKERIKGLIELFDHIDDIDYGVDEYYLIELLKKHFNDKNICIVVNNKLRIKGAILDINSEITNLKRIFTHAKIISVTDFDVLLRNNNLYHIKTDICNNLTYHLQTVGGKLCYCLYGQSMKIKNPFRVSRSEFCQERLINLIKCII